jgi:hypothetical protein
MSPELMFWAGEQVEQDLNLTRIFKPNPTSPKSKNLEPFGNLELKNKHSKLIT